MTLTATDPTVYDISGTLCYNDSNQQRGVHTVELLVSGFTYDRTYWNPGYMPNSYSWVWAATSAGYSTFAIDRLGTGLSDKPPADELTIPNEASTIKQIIQGLRAGTIGSHAFTTVVTIGHSIGGAIAQYEAGTATNAYDAPDYLVVADFLHDANTTGVSQINATMYPASSDPKFANAGLPTGYYTTEPDTRGSDYYNLPQTDPQLVADDEANKQTGTISELTSLYLARDSAVTHGVNVPTILAVGQYDKINCNTADGLPCDTAADIMTRESGNYSPTACLTPYVITASGHDTDLHISSSSYFNFVSGWITNYTVNYVGQKDANGCIP